MIPRAARPVNARLAFGGLPCYHAAMAKEGFLITNGFLKSDAFDALYASLQARASAHGLALARRTNVELMADIAGGRLLSGEKLADFAVFWDKDTRLAHLLEKRGMRLFNRAASIETCDDKALTHLALSGKVPMPKTVLIPLTFPRVGYAELDFLDRAAEYLGYPFVIKECFGSFGAQVYLAHERGEARELLQKTAGTAAIAQEFIKTSFARDIRLYVVGGRCVAAMLRENDAGDFRANVARGGKAAPYIPSAEELRVAELAAELLRLDFAGVDLLFGPNGPLLCEMNSNAHFAGISASTGADIAGAIMQHVARCVDQGR